MDFTEHSFLGVGIYSISDAARLTRVPPQRLRRWVKGYSFRNPDGNTSQSPPVVNRQLPVIDGAVALGFLDLVEVRVVDAMLTLGISWRTIRSAHCNAARTFQTSHPFATMRFRTDGGSVFADLAADSDEDALLDIAESQFAFRRFLNPYLENIEFDKRAVAMRWRPMGSKRSIVLDPQRSFGQPIVDLEGVPTSVIAQAYRAEGSERAVANWYGIKIKSVRDALAFEKLIAA
jgi:uncharacterized protein (DUF433 family)